MNESSTSPTGEIVYIVRDVEQRYVQGIYRYRANAVAAIWEMVADQTTAPEGSEEWEYCYEQHEIIAMRLEE